MSASLVLTRIAARTGIAVWRHRIAFLGAALAAAVVGVFTVTQAGPMATPDGDCADTTMTAVTSSNDSAAHAAYNCLNPSMRSASEDRWVTNMQQHAIPNGQFSRVAAKRTVDGGQIVFYSVDLDGESVGYIVYLDAQGRVRGLE